MSEKRTAVIGLGLIGSLWAENYKASGALCASWNRSTKPELDLMQTSLEECAANAEILQLCLYDAVSVNEVLDRLEPFLKPKHYILQSSTIDSESATLISERVEKMGVHYLESPFTGSQPAAEERKTVFFLGGREEDMDAVTPTLKLISSYIFRIGTPAQAATIKLAMNLQVASLAQALSESILMSRDAGITDDTFFDVMQKNASWSGLSELKEPKVRSMDFVPQFTVKNMHKDMRLVAKSSSRPLPQLDVVRDCLARAEAEGMGADDFISILRLL